MAEPQNPIVTTGLARNGKPLLITDIPETPAPLRTIPSTVQGSYSNYEPSTEIDYTDLSSVNRELIGVIQRVNRIRIELKEARREIIRTKHEYDAKKQRILISLSGGTEKSREAAAELLCEREYSDYLVANAVGKELQQHNQDLKIELDALSQLSNNLRRLIDLN